MVMSLVWEVFARYFFNAPTIWAYDMTYILYGTFFMLGSAYTLLRGKHIRTDNFYSQWSPRRQGLVDTVCYLVLFFPPLLALQIGRACVGKECRSRCSRYNYSKMRSRCIY